MYHQKRGFNFFDLDQIKKRNAFPWKFQKFLKGFPFHCQTDVDEKHL